MASGETLTLKNGTVENLTVNNQAGVDLTIDSVQVVGNTTIN